MYTSSVIKRVFNFMKGVLSHEDLPPKSRHELELAAGLLSPVVPMMVKTFAEFKGREVVEVLRKLEHEREAANVETILLALAEARAENERLEMALTCEKLSKDENLPAAAIHAVRELLEAQGVPGAAFIDDHVANAIVQRNIAVKVYKDVADRLRTIWVTDSAAEDLDKEAFLAQMEHRLREVGCAESP